jgi:hypothetical protein
VSGTPSPRPREVKKYFVAIFFRVCLLDLRFRGGPAFNRFFFFRFHFFFLQKWATLRLVVSMGQGKAARHGF